MQLRDIKNTMWLRGVEPDVAVRVLNVTSTATGVDVTYALSSRAIRLRRLRTADEVNLSEAPAVQGDTGTVDVSAYREAQLSIVWLLAADKSRHLVFASIELFPNEFPSIESEPERAADLPGAPRQRVYVRRVSLSATRALSWYASAVDDGTWVRPGNDGFVPERARLEEAVLPAAIMEPPFPQVKLLVGDDLFGIVPRDVAEPFVSSRFLAAPQSSGVMPTRQRQRISEFVLAELGIDLSADESLWGSVHLIAAKEADRNYLIKFAAVATRSSTPRGNRGGAMQGRPFESS